MTDLRAVTDGTDEGTLAPEVVAWFEENPYFGTPLEALTPEVLELARMTAPPAPAEGLADVSDSEIAGVPVRIYRQEAQPTGLVVYFHGGGYCIGSVGLMDNVAKAIASFERSLVTGPSPWDYYAPVLSFQKSYGSKEIDPKALKEDDPELYADYIKIKEASDAHPISESAIRGGELFFSDKGACTACHVGANFTDEQYHNLGVGMNAAVPDEGRSKISGDAKERGAFKTPTVRNVTMTSPYMHDGSQKTLEEVVEWYDKGGHPNPQLDAKVKPLKLTKEEKADLVAFMKALTGELPKVESGRLPE